jgi:hypothetical protein
MFKLISISVLGLSMSLAGSGLAFAGDCAPPPAGAQTARLSPPSQAAQRQTYRSYSYDPSAPVYGAPMMRRSTPSSSNRFGADRKIRGLVN